MPEPARERRGVLFDVDGTLVDSTYLHALAFWQAFRYQDLDVTMADLHRAIGMGPDKLVPHILGDRPDVDFSDDDVSALADAHDAIYSTWWPALRPLPGASALVRRCHDDGLVTVLASSAGAREVSVVRRVLEVDDYLDFATSSEDGDESKPAPDLVEAALEKAQLAPGDAIMIGDSVWDVHAASDAGVRCIGLECGGTGAAELRDAGAVEVFTDPDDLLDHFDTSLLGTRSDGKTGTDTEETR